MGKMGRRCAMLAFLSRPGSTHCLFFSKQYRSKEVNGYRSEKRGHGGRSVVGGMYDVEDKYVPGGRRQVECGR